MAERIADRIAGEYSLGPPRDRRSAYKMEAMMEPREMIRIDTNTVPWEERYQEALGKSMFLKPLLQDPDTGMIIRMVRYPAGFLNKWHFHTCSHGMFVLEGTLVTHAGVHGPGSFVWFPEGMRMEHGATATSDVVALFITNKPFDIHYEEKETLPLGS